MCGETIKHAAKVAIRHIRVATRLTAIVLRYNMADNPYMKPNKKAHQYRLEGDLAPKEHLQHLYGR
jgi:hypothetical protein